MISIRKIRLQLIGEDSAVDFAHFMLLSLYLSGVVAIGLWTFNLSLLISMLSAIIFFFLYFFTIQLCIYLIHHCRSVSGNLYTISSVAGILSAILIFSIALIFPTLAGEQLRTAKFYLYTCGMGATTLLTTFLLFYCKGYYPSKSVESLKLEVHVHLQILYLFLFAFVVGMAGAVVPSVLEGSISWQEVVGIFYGVIGFAGFIATPMSKIITACIRKIRLIDERGGKAFKRRIFRTS